jgi:hypothetical protein
MSLEVTDRVAPRREDPADDECFAFPLTAGQTAMLPRDPANITDPRFNGSFRMTLQGRVDAQLLGYSLREIAHRHEILRASFRVIDGKVHQIIFPESDLTLDTLDLRSLSENSRTVEMEDICLREARAGFDFSHGTPIRAKLLQIEDDQ